MPDLVLDPCPDAFDLGAATVARPGSEPAAALRPAPLVVMAPAATTRRIVLPVSGPGGREIDWTGFNGTLVARVLIRDPSRCDPAVFDGLLDLGTHEATVPFDPSQAEPPLCAGIYDAELVVLDPATERPAFSSRFYLAVEPSLSEGIYTHGASSMGPPTVAEMRMFLRDTDPGESTLLGRLVFSDVEVVGALRRAVDIWNGTPPIAYRLTQTPQTFPFRAQWMDGAKAQLYRQVGEHYHRNNIAYSAAGVTVDDTNKFEFYVRTGDQLANEYLGWVRMTKTALNREACYGTVSGGYGNFY